MTKHTVRFLPQDTTVEVPDGTSLLEAVNLAGINIKSTCGGDGSCGRCAILVEEGQVSNPDSGNLSKKAKEQGLVLACKTNVQSNAVVQIPKETLMQQDQILLENQDSLLAETSINVLDSYGLDCIFKRVYLTLSESTLTENSPDLPKLLSELKKQGYNNPQINLVNLKNLPEILRMDKWQVTVILNQYNGVDNIISIQPGHVKTPYYALAIDIGTTTVVVNVVDLETGQIMASKGSYNKQTQYGDDVITRIVHATNEPQGLDQLQQVIVSTINELISQATSSLNIVPEDLQGAIVAGNTTMTQLFLGINPKYIRLEPYVPTVDHVPLVKAKELGLKLHPEGIIYNFSAIASYVGGDIVSGVLATNMSKGEEIILFIDIGTNGEMVLGNQDWLVTCACSAGPAFEGGGITFGTRAMTGAIERVVIDSQSYEVQVKTIGNSKAIGICGSGLIDCLAKLRQVGLIDRGGKFDESIDTPRLCRTEEGLGFVLVWSDESDLDRDIIITESDIKNIIRAKGAIYSGIRTMLKTMELDAMIIDKVIIAGGFGNFLNIADAIQIGLLPDLPLEKYLFLGNSSVKGARICLMSNEALREAEEIANKMTYLELSVGNIFMDEFMSALFIPHTDLSQFPSVSL